MTPLDRVLDGSKPHGSGTPMAPTCPRPEVGDTAWVVKP